MINFKRNVKKDANIACVTKCQPSITSFFKSNRSSMDLECGKFERVPVIAEPVVDLKNVKTNFAPAASPSYSTSSGDLNPNNDTLNEGSSSFNPDATFTRKATDVMGDTAVDTLVLRNCMGELLKGNIVNELGVDNQRSPAQSDENSALEDVTKSEHYYHNNFLNVLDTVLSDKENDLLFNDCDLRTINAFKNLNEKEQKLFVRLFGRKHKWLRLSTLKYPEISADLSGILDALVLADLLEDDEGLADLDDVLRLLLMPELKQLCKYFGIGLKAKGKDEIVAVFQKHCQEQTSVRRFFNSDGIERKVISKAKELAGRSFRLQTDPRKVFIRVLLLYSLTGLAEDEDSANGGQQKTLVTILMVEKGSLTFPKFEVNKQVPIFRDRESLIRFQEAKHLECNLLNSYNSKCFQEAYEHFLIAEELYKEACQSEEVFSDTRLPAFLQRFTSSYVYVRCLSHGIDVLQKLKKYQDAVDVLRLLLQQQYFCKSYRGHWWDRLTLLLDYHLKNSKLTTEALCQSLKDPALSATHNYSIVKRAQKIIEQDKKQKPKMDENLSKKRRMNDEPHDKSFLRKCVEKFDLLEEAPKVTIVGRLLPGNQTGYKNVFILPSSKELDRNGDINLVSVEELALHHYRQQEYTQGIHGEGSTIVSLFCLLFWDIIYASGVPDVFRSPYQAWPLDLNTDEFYANRRIQIDAQINIIRKSSKTELENIVQSCWEKHEGCSSLVAWDLFTGPSQVQELVRSFTNEALAGICERLAKDFHQWCSGFPDLIVWNPTSNEVKVVEVKGPQDRLSPKQTVWIHFLLSMKVPVEVCHINAVGAKKFTS